MRWSEQLAASGLTFYEIPPSTRSDALSRQPSLILFSLIWLPICQRAKSRQSEYLASCSYKGEAGVRRRVSGDELGSRRLVMLIFAGYPAFRPDLSAFF